MRLLFVNHKSIKLNTSIETIKKLDYCFQDRTWKIKQYKEEIAKIETLPESVKKALDSMTELQELSLEKIKLMEQMKHSILHEHKINVRSFKFRV
jgi:hypothetical protein